MTGTDLSRLRFKTMGQHSVSGLSSGAFMAVQLHLAHSASFMGAGIIAGGPYRAVESFRGAAAEAVDAYTLSAQYVCMAPLTRATAPNARRLATLARETARDKRIDPIANLANDRLYIFTGTRDAVVSPLTVESARDFYRELGVAAQNILFVNDIPAGHAILTANTADLHTAANQPPYINYGGFWQSHALLNHIYGIGEDPDGETPLTGELVRFAQHGFLPHGFARSSMDEHGYVYIPGAVRRGEAKARGVHVVLHGCKQGVTYVNFVLGKADIANQPPYGLRFVTSTGYNEWAERHNVIVLYPQATGRDSNKAQNPDGCWDWWGYSAKDLENPDYYSQEAVQIAAIYRMLAHFAAMEDQADA